MEERHKRDEENEKGTNNNKVKEKQEDLLDYFRIIAYLFSFVVFISFLLQD